MKVLVTGGAGFNWSHLVDLLNSKGFDNIVYDNLSTGNFDNILLSKHDIRHPKIIRGDILDSKKLVLSLDNVDVVVHLAAIVSVNLSIENPLLVHEVDTAETLQLLNACMKRKVRRFLFASSAAVYSESPHKSRETDLPKPPVSIRRIEGRWGGLLQCHLQSARSGDNSVQIHEYIRPAIIFWALQRSYEQVR